MSLGAPVALPHNQAMPYWVIFNSQLQAGQECRARVWHGLWLCPLVTHDATSHGTPWCYIP